MGFSPTTDEQVKIQQLKTALEEHLNGETSISPKCRQEIKNAAVNPNFLYKYLRGRKLNVNRAFDTILKYVDIKCNIYPEYFPENIPNYVQRLDANILLMLSKKDELGRTYFLVDTTKHDDSIISMEEAINVFRYIIESLMNSTEFIDNGLVILEDCRGVQLKHGKNGPSLSKFCMTFWRGFPVKLKALIYFNAPIYGKSMFSLCKAFVKSNVLERVHISSGLEAVHKRVPLDILPKSLGGNVPDEDAFVPTEKLLAMALGK